jgi:hypothetical protein
MVAMLGDATGCLSWVYSLVWITNYHTQNLKVSSLISMNILNLCFFFHIGGNYTIFQDKWIPSH